VPYRVHLVTVLVGLLAAAGALVGPAAGAATPPMTLNVNIGGALEVVLGNGTRIRTATAPGTVIPPGQYLTIVASDIPDTKDLFHFFHLSGPGVNVSTDLLPCMNPEPISTVTLLPSSTYTYEDSRHPELTHVVFTTSATGSSSDTAGSTAGPATGDATGSTSNSSVVGSRTFRGGVTAAVSAAGTLTLVRNGKGVTSLKTGRYQFVIVDRSKTKGFTLQRGHTKFQTLTGVAFTGKRSVTVALKSGAWTFSSAGAGSHAFTVVD